MVEANKRRMAWYVGLQRLLQSPKSYIAPVMVSRFRHKPEIADGGTAEPSELLQRNQVDVYKPHKLADSLSISAPRANNLFASDLDLLTTIGRGTTTGGDAPRVRQLWTPTRELRPPSTAPIPQFSIPAIVTARRNPLEDRRQYQTMLNFGLKPDRARSSSPLAPIGSLDFKARIDSTPIDQTSRRMINGAIDMSDQHGSTLDTDNSPTALLSADRYEEMSSSKGSGTNSQQTRPSQLGVSTIHLDGAALGRWAVQYLERALGKPGTGMTGIDPRAIVPRSRVAPF